jgi:hypothetical protein
VVTRLAGAEKSGSPARYHWLPNSPQLHRPPCLTTTVSNKNTKMDESLGKRRSSDSPNWDPAQAEAPRPDTIIDTVVCLQTRVYHDCPLKGAIVF